VSFRSSAPDFSFSPRVTVSILTSSRLFYKFFPLRRLFFSVAPFFFGQPLGGSPFRSLPPSSLSSSFFPAFSFSERRKRTSSAPSARFSPSLNVFFLAFQKGHPYSLEEVAPSGPKSLSESCFSPIFEHCARWTSFLRRSALSRFLNLS